PPRRRSPWGGQPGAAAHALPVAAPAVSQPCRESDMPGRELLDLVRPVQDLPALALRQPEDTLVLLVVLPARLRPHLRGHLDGLPEAHCPGTPSRLAPRPPARLRGDR